MNICSYVANLKVMPSDHNNCYIFCLCYFRFWFVLCACFLFLVFVWFCFWFLAIICFCFWFLKIVCSCFLFVKILFCFFAFLVCFCFYFLFLACFVSPFFLFWEFFEKKRRSSKLFCLKLRLFSYLFAYLRNFRKKKELLEAFSF